MRLSDLSRDDRRAVVSAVARAVRDGGVVLERMKLPARLRRVFDAEVAPALAEARAARERNPLAWFASNEDRPL